MNFSAEDEQTGAHADVNKNIEYCVAECKKIDFHEDIKPHMQKELDGNPMCIMFAWGPMGARNGCFCLSLHQSHDAFKYELKGIFDAMGSRNVIKRKDIHYEQMRYGI